MTEDIKSINKPTTPAPPAQDWLEIMPANIREWLGSNALLYLIINLNKRLGLEGIKSAVVPDLILQVAIKELRPKDLPEKLSKGLGVSGDVAFNITKEIEEKMLRPIEVPLRNELGIDIKEIYAAPTPKLPPPSISPLPGSRNSTEQALRGAEESNFHLPGKPPKPLPPPPIPVPVVPVNPPAINEVPVKINVQPVRPPQSEKPSPSPASGQPFGSDSWINKLK
ncbi:MAG: hypothetical protein AAB389_02770 [Patescibacteria group bacterium]